MSSFVDTHNLRSYADAAVHSTDVESIGIEDAQRCIGDTLKFSRCANSTIANKTIGNNGEDCIDMVRCRSMFFEHCYLFPLGKNGVTIKGASLGIYLGLRFLEHGRECDIELGQFDNYWFPGRVPTAEVTIDATSFDGKPIVVRCWDADKPHLVNGTQAEIKCVPKCVWFPYFLFRYAQIRVLNLFYRLSGKPLIKTS